MKRRILNLFGGAAMKRRILNIFALFVIVAVGFLASRLYDPPKPQIGGFDGPELRTLVVVDHLVDLERGRIALALELPEDTTSSGLIADVLEAYRWANSHYLPVKCGNAYPPEMCRIGVTHIYLLRPMEISHRGVMVELDGILVWMWLDQFQVDRLLAGTPPETQSELFAFHLTVAEETLKTGGGLTYYNPPQIFQGFQ